MIFLEMSRDELHGGKGWSYRSCVWSPVSKEKGGTWPFWSKILEIHEGDTVIHLRGTGRSAAFEGYSTAVVDGYETELRPPNPGKWGYSQHFYRADLRDFTPFEKSVPLVDVFGTRRGELEKYFESNRSARPRRNIFFVRQSGRLQCLNGAYLSEVDEKLFAALFGYDFVSDKESRQPFITVRTGELLSVVARRLGQDAFSDQIHRLYSNACCFPDCSVTHPRFLVGSHIARWSDDAILRGHPGNGLCLCLLHDKAFEIGLFTLDGSHRVVVRPNMRANTTAKGLDLSKAHGQQIRLGEVHPLIEALEQHWKRIGYVPGDWE